MRNKGGNKGFTLVELVVGIVVLAVAMMVMNTFFLSQTKDALEPVYRLRASQLGQSLMQDILARAYDQNSDHNGGYYRCGEIWQNGALWSPDGSVWQKTGTPAAVPCTAVDKYGPDAGENNVSDYNDVDDFITGFVDASAYVAGYYHYKVRIAVVDDKDNSSGVLMKRIDVTVKTPSSEEILFSALKGNY